MSRSLDPTLAKILTFLAAESKQAEAAMLQSAKGRENKRKKRKFAEAILKAMEDATTVEELVYTELFLQSLDRENAVTTKDKTSVANARREYAQIVETIEQMRQSPAEYFKANLSLQETGGDFRKMPRSRGLKQINGNITRLQGRDSFSDAYNRLLWMARIALARKTASMLRALHKTLVTNDAPDMQ